MGQCRGLNDVGIETSVVDCEFCILPYQALGQASRNLSYFECVRKSAMNDMTFARACNLCDPRYPDNP